VAKLVDQPEPNWALDFKDNSAISMISARLAHKGDAT
jgi:hypothetical protein